MILLIHLLQQFWMLHQSWREERVARQWKKERAFTERSIPNGDGDLMSHQIVQRRLANTCSLANPIFDSLKSTKITVATGMVLYCIVSYRIITLWTVIQYMRGITSCHVTSRYSTPHNKYRVSYQLLLPLLASRVPYFYHSKTAFVSRKTTSARATSRLLLTSETTTDTREEKGEKQRKQWQILPRNSNSTGPCPW